MKKVLSLLFALVLCVLTLSLALPVFADTTEADAAADTAIEEGVLAYDGLSARTIADYFGIRSIYTVKKESIAALEKNGYKVAYGAIAAVGENGSETLRLVGDLTVTKDADGKFVSGTDAVSVVTVYATAGTASAAYATNKYIDREKTKDAFAYTIIYNTDADVSVMQDYGLVFRAFLYIEDAAGNTAIRYVDAAGDVFGNAESEYGLATSLYELSEYLSRKYIENGVKPYENTPNCYHVVLRCEKTFDIPVTDITGGTLVEADTENATLAARTLTNAGGFGYNNLTFKVRAEKGFYRFQLLSSNANTKLDIAYTVNGRGGSTRLVADGNADSTVKSDAAYTDKSAFYAYLDEGINEIRVYINGSNVNGTIAVASVRMEQLRYVTDKDVYAGGYEDVVKNAGTAKYPSYLNNNASGAAYKNGTFSQATTTPPVYKLVVGETGNYRLSALLAANTPNIVLNMYTDEALSERYLSATNSDTDKVYKMGDGSEALIYKEICGIVYLEAGTYYYTLHGNYQLSLADHVFRYAGKPATESGTYSVNDFLSQNGSTTVLPATETTRTTAVLKQNVTFGTTVNVEMSGIYKLYATWAEPKYVKDLYITTADGYGTLYRSATNGSNKKPNDYSADTDADTIFAVDKDAEEKALAFVYLNAGENALNFCITGSATPVGLSTFRLELVTPMSSVVKELKAGDAGIARPDGVTSGGYNNTILNQKNMTDASRASIQWNNFTVPATGTYTIYAYMSSSRVPNTVTATVSENGTTVGTLSAELTGKYPLNNDSNGAYAMCFTGGSLVYAEFGDVTLTGGTSYNLNMVGTGTNSWNISKVLLVKKTDGAAGTSTVLYPSYTPGSVTSGGIMDSDTSVVTKLMTIPKKGTVLYLTEYGYDRLGNAVSFSAAGTYPISVWEQDALGAWNIVADRSVEAGGYTNGDGRVAHGGRVTYKYVTQSDNETVRFSYVAGAATYYESVVGYADEPFTVTVVNENDLKENNEITLSDVTLDGKNATVIFSVVGKKSGKLIVAYYNEADQLMATETFDKAAYKVAYTSTATTAMDVKTVRIYTVGDTTSYAQNGETLFYSVRSGNAETVMLPIDFYTLSEELLTPANELFSGKVIHLADANPVLGTGVTQIGNTYLLPVGTGEPSVSKGISFTYNAPVSGYYAIRIQAKDCGSFQRVHLYSSVNGSYYGGYQAHNDRTNKGTATSDADYVLADNTRYAFFDGNVMYQYLNKGQNTLTIAHRSDSGAKFGISDVQVMLYDEIADGSKVLPYSAMRTAEDNATSAGYTSNRGWQYGGLQFGGDKYLYQKVTITESGLYSLSAMMCSDTNTVYVTDAGEKALPVTCDIKVSLASADWKMAGVPVTLGQMMLEAGDYVFKLSADSLIGGISLMAFEKIGVYDVAGTYSVNLSGVSYDVDTDLLTMVCQVGGYVDNATAPHSGKVVLSIYDKENTSTALVTLAPLAKTDFIQTFNIEETLAELQGNKNYVIKADYYDENDTLLQTVQKDFSTYDAKILFITDIHFSGSNDYVNGGRVLTQGSYYGEAEFYGWDNENKLQLTMDQLIKMYREGTYDMVFVDGDVSRNDSFTRKFMPQDQRYWNAYKRNNPYNSYAESYAAAEAAGVAQGLTGDALTAYAKEQAIAGTFFLGNDISEFWGSVYDNNYVIVQKFFSQLTAEHIPYFLVIGNHDWEFELDRETGETDWSPWENQLHYGEIFGYDYDDFLVRMMSVEGEGKKILTVLSDEKLQEYKDAGYTFYTNEAEVAAWKSAGKKVKNLCSVAVFNTFDYVYDKDSAEKYPSYNGINVAGDITVYSGLNRTYANMMMADAEEFGAPTYLTAHIFHGNDSVLLDILDRYDIVKAMVYGDEHDEKELWVGGRPSWCAGCIFSSFDLDQMKKADGTLDNVYYYARSGQSGAQSYVWGDMETHPWSMVHLYASDSKTVLEREHLTAYYQNGKQNLTHTQMVGRDIRYTRARLDMTDKTKLSTLTFTDKTGTAAWHIGEYIEENGVITGYKFYDAENTYVKTVNTLTFSYIKDGEHVLFVGNEVLDTDGVTMRKGCLFDENRNYVFVDADGKYVYINFEKDESGDYKREWFYISNDAEYLAANPLGFKDADLSGTVTYTDVATVHDTIGQKYFHESGCFNVSSAAIVVKDGVVDSGARFLHYNYVYTFTYADGSAATPLEDKENGETVYGLYIPPELYHELSILY